MSTRKLLGILSLVAVLAFAIKIHSQFWNYDTFKSKDDIYYIWREGQRLLVGENPYARILSGNMEENHKYPTYFPVFYLFAYVTQLLGLRDYSAWIDFWRHLNLIFNLGIATIIFYIFERQKLLLLAIFLTCFWLFNRWTLYVSQVAHIDFLAILLLILSLLIFQKHKWISLLLFSFSLGVKQIAVFLIPIYLIWVWQSTHQNKTKKAKTVLLAAAVILSIPLISSLPFIIWNAEGWAKSIFFSVTREETKNFGVPSLFANQHGILRSLPTLFLLALIYLGVLQRRIGKYTSALLVLSVFVDFNAVLFRQYMCWLVPFVPLTLSDFASRSDPKGQASFPAPPEQQSHPPA
jgi:hypothetical protein